MPVEWIAFVGPLLALASHVVEAAGRTQRYKRKCRLLAKRVELISQHLGALQQSQWTHNPPETAYTLECLEQVLNQAEGLVRSCQRKRKTFDFFKAFKNRGEFSFVNKRLDHIMETFHMANHTLLMLSLYGDHIFMIVLETLLEDGACRRLTQDRKDKLEKAMDNFLRNDNMPTEKKQMLELIRRELTQGSGSWQWDANSRGRSSSTSNDNNRGQNQNQHVTTEVTALAREIVQEAQEMNHNKNEVERVSQLAQQVASLLPHLQSPRLARQQDEWRQLLHNLQNDLSAALETIRRYRNSAYASCGAPLVSTSFSRQLGKQITEHGNKIEQHYQRLTFIIIRQIISNE